MSLFLAKKIFLSLYFDGKKNYLDFFSNFGGPKNSFLPDSVLFFPFCYLKAGKFIGRVCLKSIFNFFETETPQFSKKIFSFPHRSEN